MKARSLAFAVPLVCALGAAVACSENPPPQSPGVTSAQPLSGHDAAARLADARCKHASACNEIGGDRKYGTMDACMNQSRGEAENDLRTASCPRGVDASRLDACIAQVNSEACSGFASGFSRMEACRTGQLCP